jgi:uncharacterized protein
MSVTNIKRIGTDQADVEKYMPDQEKILAGNPAQLIWHCYDNKDKTFGAGIWEGEPGSHKVSYTEEEVCYLLEGEVVVADEDGNQIVLMKGDMFAIPAGFSGVWTTIEKAKKLYVVYEK